MGSLLGWLILGALAGWVASIIMGTNRRQGLIKDILLGVGGAVVGGWLSTLVGMQKPTGLNWPSFVVALGGAVLLLLIFKRRR